MSGRGLFRRVAELEAAGGTFAVATVVAVQRPTSARPGAAGIVHPDGTIEGWVGGSCAQPVVVREALRSLADGHPRLLRLSKTAPAEGRRGDGVVELVMTCHSGGTLEIYVEPHLPAPSLWIAGTTPIVGALVDPRRRDRLAGDGVRPDRRRRRLPRRRAGVDRRPPSAGSTPSCRPYVVVATQGHLGRGGAGRGPPARRVVRRPGRLADPGRRRPRVAARRGERARGAARRAPGAAPASTSAPRRPRRSPLSILAELVQVRRGRAPFVAAPGPATLAGDGGATRLEADGRSRPVVDDIVLLDPVCGMTVDREHARHLAEHDGVVYAFCSMGCRTAFIKEPGAYVAGSTTADA